MPASPRQVFATMAARQAEVMLSCTPADDSGSMNDAASPTRRTPESAARRARYTDASHAHSADNCVASFSRIVMPRALASADAYASRSADTPARPMTAAHR